MANLSDFLKNAFSYKESNEKFTKEEEELMDRLSKRIVDMKLTAPAIFLLETSRPLNFVGSQVLAFFEPIVKSFFNWKDYERIRLILERRNSISTILEKIEKYSKESGSKDGA